MLPAPARRPPSGLVQGMHGRAPHQSRITRGCTRYSSEELRTMQKRRGRCDCSACCFQRLFRAVTDSVPGCKPFRGEQSKAYRARTVREPRVVSPQSQRDDQTCLVHLHAVSSVALSSNCSQRDDQPCLNCLHAHLFGPRASSHEREPRAGPKR